MKNAQIKFLIKQERIDFGTILANYLIKLFLSIAYLCIISLECFIFEVLSLIPKVYSLKLITVANVYLHNYGVFIPNRLLLLGIILATARTI